MPKYLPRRLIYRELVKKLQPLGIEVLVNRGKGSERMLYQKSTRFNYPIKYHGSGEEYSKETLKAIQRRFSIPDEIMWG